MTSETIIAIVVACLGSAGLWTFINNVYLNHTKDNETIALLKQAQLAVLQDRLLYLSTKYLDEKSIETNQLQSLHKMYEAYKALGGNEFITDLMNRVNKLPIR